MKSNKPARKYNSLLVNQLLAEISDVEKVQTGNRMILAARLDDLVKARGWTKSEFATKVGKSPSEITKWLSGTQNFTIDTLTEISLAFNMPLAEVLAPPAPQPKVIKYTFIYVEPKKITSSSVNEKEADLTSSISRPPHSDYKAILSPSNKAEA